MRIAVTSMVYKDHEMLRRWYNHYSGLVGARNIYLVSHGDDPLHRTICPDANIIGIPKEKLNKFERTRQSAMVQLQKFASNFYDVVMQVDADELVFFDPTRYQSLQQVFEENAGRAWFATGFEVFHASGEADLNPRSLVSEIRKYAFTNSYMCKAVASRQGFGLAWHGVIGRDNVRYSMPQGLYLAHLKYADNTIRAQADIRRRAANEGEPPGTWQWGVRRNSDDMFNDVLNQVEEDGMEVLERFRKSLAGKLGTHKAKFSSVVVVPQVEEQTFFKVPKQFEGCF